MHEVGLVLYPDFQILGLSMCSVFEWANIVAQTPFYAWTLVSEDGGFVHSSAGPSVDTKAFSELRFSTLIVLGDNNATDKTPGLLDYIYKSSQGSTQRVASVCTGAFALAKAGLLKGRMATTHWNCSRALQRKYPDVKVGCDSTTIQDGSVWTAGGMTACLDLALAFVEKDMGSKISRAVARHLLVQHRPTGMRSPLNNARSFEPETERIKAALAFAKSNLTTDLTVDDLAQAARLSRRQFSRVFHEETGQSPAKAIENLRLDSARSLMESGDYSVDWIATHAGFGNSERMRRAFLRAFGQPPQSIQRLNRSW